VNPYLDKFRDYSSEHLLERRALGEDGLSAEAHEAIELLLVERGVSFPPIPKRSIQIDRSKNGTKKTSIANQLAMVGVLLLGLAVSKMLAQSWIGLAIGAGVAIFALADWFRRQRLTDQERSFEDDEKRAESDGMTDLMRAAADGDLQRLSELLAYGATVNATSHIGSTALMYAARNGHSEVVNTLLKAGADLSIRTDKGNSARDLAEKAGHQEITSMLDRAMGVRNLRAE